MEKSFRIGLRVKWVVTKTDKEWLDGFITKVEIKMGEPGCSMTFFQVGQIVQNTYNKVQFPYRVHEIHLPPVKPHLQLSEASLQKGFSISFRYNAVWKLGWVTKLVERTCYI